MNIRRQILFMIALLSFGSNGVCEPESITQGNPVSRSNPGFPVPPQNEHSLFYVQRSKNTNAIVYETNTLPDGSLNPDEPVRIYWLRYASDSTRDDLTYIQRKYAYGIEATAVKSHPGQYVLNFVSYSKKKIYLVKDGESMHYRAYTSINGKLAELKRIFINLNGGTFWFPRITDIEILGKDPLSQKIVVEHFVP